MDSFFDEGVIKELQDNFLEDLNTRISSLNKNLVEIEKEGFNREKLFECFRILHNIKGTSATLGLSVLATLSHRIEDQISLALEQEEPFSEEAISLLFKYTDGLSILHKAYMKNAEKAGIELLLAKILGEEKVKQKRVLIVEPSKSIRNFISKFIEGKKMLPILAHSTLDALNRTLSEPIDFLITSHEHNLLSGLNLIRMLKANSETKTMKTILLTSESINDSAPTLIIKKEKDFMNKIGLFLDKSL